MKAYSLDLRQKVMAAVERGEMSRQEVARVFGVTYAWIKKLQRQRRERGSIAPLPHGGGQQCRLGEKQLKKLREVVDKKPDVTLEKLCERIRGSDNRKVSLPTMSRALARLGLTRKKEGSLCVRTGSSGEGLVRGTN